MARTTYTTTRFTCDRCGHLQDGGSMDRWAEFDLERHDGSNIVHSPQGSDICPDCCDSLNAWFNSPGQTRT